jgi:hypothetical protein
VIIELALDPVRLAQALDLATVQSGTRVAQAIGKKVRDRA